MSTPRGVTLGGVVSSVNASPQHDMRRALLDAVDEYEPSVAASPQATSAESSQGTAGGEDSAQLARTARIESSSQQGYEQEDDGDDGDEDQEEDNTDGGQDTDGGRGAASEPEMGSSHRSGYHSSDGIIHRQRIARVRNAQQRPPLSFGPPMRRASAAPTRSGGSSTRRADRASADGSCAARGTRRDTVGSVGHMASTPHPHPIAEADGDPLEWRGHQTPPLQPQSAFGLPPLLADLTEARASHSGANGHGPKVMRCTSYCCSLGIDLLALHRHLSEGRGLVCRMHKDGLNAVLHCAEQVRAA